MGTHDWMVSLGVAGTLFCCLPGSARGQDVTITAALTNPVTVWASGLIPMSQTVTQPAGLVAPSGSFGVSTGSASGQVSWSEQATASAASFSLESVLNGGPIFGASCDPVSMVLDVSAASMRTVELDFERLTTIFIAGPTPTVSIDIHNDGVVEYADLPMANVVTVPGLTVGPTPLQIGVHVSAVTILNPSSIEFTSTKVDVTVRPDNQLVAVKDVSGCLPGQPGMEPPVPVFADGGVDLHFEPGLLVAGLQSMPILWTPTSPLPFAANCLVGPEPDVLLWLPSGFLHVPLPPAVRPVQFHVQVVFFGPSGLVASDGYQISAN